MRVKFVASLAVVLAVSACAAVEAPQVSPRVTLGDEQHPGDIAPLKACLTEDDVDCYWDAEKRGNRKGRSFTVTKDGKVRYWSAVSR